MAFTANADTIRNLNTPSMESTIFSSMYGSQYSETVNSAWTHPNPFVTQVGNHIFHKDRVPHGLRFNDQKRDKEALDNVRNRALRNVTADYTPAYTAQAVPPPPPGAYVPYGLTHFTNPTLDTVAYAYAPKSVPPTALPYEPTMQVPIVTPAPLLQTSSSKSYSPLALPHAPSGPAANGYGYYNPNYGTGYTTYGAGRSTYGDTVFPQCAPGASAYTGYYGGATASGGYAYGGYTPTVTAPPFALTAAPAAK